MLRDDLVESLNAWVVKVVDSQMLKLYSPNAEPALVFFRNGIPLLYDGKKLGLWRIMKKKGKVNVVLKSFFPTGPLNDDEIFNTFINNKEPVVKELSDDNFEHLTQASSGATTGDWFIMLWVSQSLPSQIFSIFLMYTVRKSHYTLFVFYFFFCGENQREENIEWKIYGMFQLQHGLHRLSTPGSSVGSRRS